MAASEDVLRQRLHSKQEAFDNEWKPWPDPTNDFGRSVIAKACIALRNNNGGFLILGIDNKGDCVNSEVPTNIRSRYHSDVIQGIVSKNSTEAFEVHVHFVERESHLRVLIEVPGGVKTPVFSKDKLPRNDTETTKAGDLLRENTAYVRTLKANGVVSSAPATATDWPRLIGFCFDNREADIGAFARRQLSGIDTENLVNALQQVFAKTSLPTPNEQLTSYLDEMHSRFVLGRDSLIPKPPKTGTRESAAIILGEFRHPELTKQYMYTFLQIPQYSGWPPFVELTRLHTSRHAKYIDKGWESFEYVSQTFNFLDFSRIDESGRFYFVEALSDDMSNRVKANETVEFVEEISRVTETIAICLEFAKQFCGTDSPNDLAFAFRWRELKGRRLCSWMDTRRGNRVYGQNSEQNDFIEHVTMPVATRTNAIGQYVEAVISPMFRLFGGHAFESSVIQNIVTDRLNGR